jgi:hypothetical protein
LLIAIANSLVPEVPASGSAVLFTERQEQAMRAGLEFCRAGETARGAEMLAKLLESAPCGK